MKTPRSFLISMFIIAVIPDLNGCAGMSAQDKNTEIGAGGVVGNAVSKGKKQHQ